MTTTHANVAASNKQVLVVFETYSHFSAAGTRLKELVRRFGTGGSIKRSGPRFAILATPELLARIESTPTPASSLLAKTVMPSAAEATPSISQETSKGRTASTNTCATNGPTPRPNSATSKASVPIRSSGPPLAYAHVISARTGLNRDRLDKMVAELRHAYSRLPSSTAASWGANIVKRLGSSFTRRVGNVVDLSIFLLEKTGGLVIDFSKAAINGRGIEHSRQLGTNGWAAGAKFVESSSNAVRSLIADLRSKPKEVAPELLVSALAFFVVGGGLDGDGGVPDLDIELFGIGGHRSIFTHSIVAGTIIETSLYSLIDLVVIAHNHLPENHDPLWDSIFKRSHSVTSGLVRGSSAGLAYHLAVDSVVQPGVFRDLPFSAPLEVHQVIAGANAASEAKEAATSRVAPTKQTGTPPIPSAKPTTNAAPNVDLAKIGKLALGGAFALAGWLLS